MTPPKLKDPKLAARLIAADIDAIANKKSELLKQREQVNAQIDNEIAQCDALIEKWLPTLAQE